MPPINARKGLTRSASNPALPLLCSVLLSAACSSACAQKEDPNGGRGSDREGAASHVLGSPDATSADVETLSIARADLRNAPALRPIEDLRIGALDGPENEQFFQISDIVVDSDGVIYVLDGGSRSVRMFNPDGAFVRSFGRRGEGPGEFDRPRFLGVAPDTVLVFDRQLVHEFSRQGELRRATPVEAPPGFAVSFIAVQHTSRGWLVGMPMPIDRGGIWRTAQERREPVPFRDTVSIHLFDASSSTIGPAFAMLPGRETYMTDNGGYLRFALHSPTPRVVLGPNGTIYMTLGDAYRVDIYTAEPVAVEAPGLHLNARHVRRISADAQRVPVTQSDFDEWMRLELAEFDERPEQGEYATMLEILEEDMPNLPRAEFRPIVGRMLTDGTGGLLIERLDLDRRPFEPGDTTVWDWVDSARRILGRVSLPPTVTPVRFVAESLYAVLRDDLDVQYVVRYDLRSERVAS